MENSTLQNINKIRDPKFYLENFCKIKGKKQGNLIPFILNNAQKDLFNTIKKHSRIIICKARQIGFSSAVVAWMYHNTITNPGTTTAIIGYNTQLTAELLDKVKILHKSTPVELRPTMHYDNKWEMSFPRLNSKILVLSSTENVGHGYTLHNCLATELSLWENQEEKITGLDAAVPIGGRFIIESTPRGLGNHYARLWFDKDSSFVKKEYGWEWGYSEEEIEIIRKRLNNPRLFSQEYDLMFLSSGLSVFDVKKVNQCRKNILKVGDKVKDGSNEHTVCEDDGWIIYKRPNLNHYYVCGADPADGVDGGDYSAAIILDRTTGEEVAFFHNRLPQDVFAKKLNDMGRKYNNALMVVEMNSGGPTMMSLKTLLYPSIYFRPAKFENLGESISEKIGWRTTRINRQLLINDFDKIFREGGLLLHSKILLDEMLTFIYDKNGDMNADKGYYDDCIFAVSVALQGFKMMFAEQPTQLDYTKYLPKTFSY